MRAATYPDYRTTGIAWLPRVPSHWPVARMGQLFREVNEPGNDELPVLSVSIHHGVSDAELPEEELDRKVSRSDDRSKYKRVRPGDLVYNMMRAWQGGFGTVRVEGAVSPAYVVARPAHEVEARFIELLLRTPQAVTEMKRFSKGVTDFRLRLYWDEFKCIRLALPNRIEQLGIINFLDRETAKIDALVDEQNRLIELLQEKRQAVISHAVTKGLDPNASMKDSGVEWLGQVPRHWGRPLKLASLASREKHSFVNGPFGSDLLTTELRAEGVPVIYIRDLKLSGYARVSEWCVTEDKAAELKFCNALPGDILIAKVGDPPGLAALYPDEEPDAIVTQDVIRLRPDLDHVVPGFLVYLLNSAAGKALVDQISVESTRTRVGLGDYKEMKVCMPPVQEQQQIVTYLDKTTAQLDHLKASAEAAVWLLGERRSSLISAVVTGKIDVRGSANVEAEAA